ncbi:MAG: GMC family oxidoreductase [bacterium]|nr:GMC family oxidoreductase [bacterium]
MPIKSTHYDAIVIGSGMGGSVCAHRLAKAGMKTLVLERGGWAKRDALDWNQREILVRQRYRGEVPIQIRQYEDRDFKPVYGAEVVGGMSVFYGGASLRLRETDFESWPIEYMDLEPFYTRVETLLEVHGKAGQDPFEPPRSADYPFAAVDLSSPAERIFRAGCALGYRPFQIPLAINFSNPGRTTCIRCITCDGFPCQIEAKNDAATTALKQAQAYGLEVMPNVMVARLGEKGGRVETVECIDKEGRSTFSLSAPLIVVSAGALQSPALLLRSGFGAFAQGDRIGRFLMRHCNTIVTYIFPFRTNPDHRFHKQICFSDFYEVFREAHGRATGVIQDIYTPAPEVLSHFAPWGGKHLAAWTAPLMQNLLCVAEDEPQYENRVFLSKSTDVYGLPQIQVRHAYSEADCERRDYLVLQARKVLKQAGGIIPYTYRLDSFSHAVGTLAFGTDESVLDVHCRFRGLENLFVVDGSFMPTSGGVNPSLTIAANALRVGDYLVEKFCGA